MMEMWTNFAKFLDPTPDDEETTALAGVKWLKVTPEKHEYLRIDTDLAMEMSAEYMERMGFWKEALSSPCT